MCTAGYAAMLARTGMADFQYTTVASGRIGTIEWGSWYYCEAYCILCLAGTAAEPYSCCYN